MLLVLKIDKDSYNLEIICFFFSFFSNSFDKFGLGLDRNLFWSFSLNLANE